MEQSVLPAAIDMQGTSVNRHKYNPDPTAAKSAARGETGVARVRVRDFPPPLEVTGGSTFEFRADDLPTDENPAHAEIRPYRIGDDAKPARIKSGATRTKLKEELARKMKVLPPAPLFAP